MSDVSRVGGECNKSVIQYDVAEASLSLPILWQGLVLSYAWADVSWAFLLTLW